MHVPEHQRELRWITILWVISALVWLSFEGELSGTVILGIFSSALFLAQGGQKLLAGRRFSPGIWLLLAAVIGLFWGILAVLFSLLLMVVKTGVHAHGPEFTTNEITWIGEQLPIWAFAGLLAGLGLGLITLTLTSRRN